MYVDEDGNVYTQEQWVEKNSTKKKDVKKDIVTTTISTEDLYKNRINKVYYKKSFYEVELNSDIEHGYIYEVIDYPFLLKINLLDKKDYKKYIKNITFYTIEIDPDTAKFGGRYKKIDIPKNSRNKDVLEITNGDKTEYITLNVISFEDFDEANKSFFIKNWKIITVIVGTVLFISMFFKWILLFLGFILVLLFFINK